MRLTFEALTLKYGEIAALREVSAAVEGRVIGFLGSNASGKTSVLKILAGIIPATEGRALIDSEEIRPGRRAWISYMPQETGFFPFVQRPIHTLSASLWLRGINDPEAAKQVLAALGLEEEDRPAEGYSGGMKQKLRIAQALVHAPRVLLLDEPTTGLDARERFQVLRLVERLRDAVSVIFATHQPEDAASVSDAVLILHRGVIVASGTPSELARTAVGHVFEVTVSSSALPAGSYDIVRANRDGQSLHLRVVGDPPPGAHEVPPHLEDAYLWLTRRPR